MELRDKFYIALLDFIRMIIVFEYLIAKKRTWWLYVDILLVLKNDKLKGTNWNSDGMAGGDGIEIGVFNVKK